MSQAPGWDAIDEALDKLYEGVEPLHYGTIRKYSEGGPDPLDGVSIYESDAGRPHWHYVSYGMSELYEKSAESNPETSGWGFEFTFRLARPTDGSDAPIWPMSMMQNLGRYVFETGNTFGAGHHMDLNSPIRLDAETDIRAVVFGLDPQLGRIETPNGSLKFLQIVGVTLDELNTARSWNAESFLQVLAGVAPLLVTDLDRRSILTRPEVATLVAQRLREEGSSMAATMITGTLNWTVRRSKSGEKLRLTVESASVNTLRSALIGRLMQGREFTLDGEVTTVILRPGRRPKWSIEADTLTIDLTETTAKELAAALQERQGDYSSATFEALSIRVEPTEIRDDEGNVTRVLG